LLSIAAAGSPVVGADPSSTISSCVEDVEFVVAGGEDELVTGVVVLLSADEVVGGVEEEVTVEVVVAFGSDAYTAPAAIIIMTMTTIAITFLEMARTPFFEEFIGSRT